VIKQLKIKHFNIQLVPFILDNGMEDSDTVKAQWFGLMVLNMNVNGIMVLHLAKENLLI
jgi:hypothetical protein